MDSSATPRSVEAIFAAHVRGCAGALASDESAAFEELCRRRGGVAAELRSLRERWQSVQSVVALLLEHRPLHELLQQEFGTAVDPRISLDEVDEVGDSRETETKEVHRRADGAAPIDDSSAATMQHAGVRSPTSATATSAAAPQRDGDATATRRDRYAVKEELGRGGMGVVYKVHDSDLRRHLAMKVIRNKGDKGDKGENGEKNDAAGVASSARPDPVQLARFLEEAQITAQLAHPNIAPVHDLGLDANGDVYFTMRFVQGRTFADVIRWVWEGKEGWTQTRALSVLLDVCDALSFAHAKNVIHRDVKPANVMVGRFGETYVMDWGLARVLGKTDRHDVRVKPQDVAPLSSIHTNRRDDADSSRADSPVVTMDGAVVGTPAYMSPEQAAGRIEAMGPASDVYAVGAMLYQLLTNQMPYVAPGARVSPYVVLAGVVSGPPRRIHELNSQVPAELEAICEKAMARTVADRYGDTRSFAADLRAYLDRRVVKAYRTGAGAELRKWVERNRGLAAAIAASVLIAAGGAITVAAVQTKAKSALQTKNDELGVRNSELATARNVAEGERRIAQARLDDVQRLSDLKRLRDLERRADALWPAWPPNAAAMEQWLADARTLRDRLPIHRTSLEKLAIASDVDAWWKEQLTELVRELDAFGAPLDTTIELPVASTIAGIEKRLAHAKWVEQTSLDEAVDAWQAAIERVAKSPRYGGMRLAEQVGLVPIGPDPKSGLEEFWAIETGSRPERDAKSGVLTIGDETGMVLVLLPGGTFHMGAHAVDATHPIGAPDVDPSADSDDGPVHDVTLAPFFESKYEATQGQWLEVTGANPSWFSKGGGDGHARSLASPVETVHRLDCVETGRRVGLLLPTDAQWEYAARAGTTTVWWSGDDVRSVAFAGNVADESAKRAHMDGGAAESWDDHFADVAPVGRFLANPFGLHDVVGNVWEWCRDEYVADASSVAWRAGDSLLQLPEGAGKGYGIARGGGFFLPADQSRSANRFRITSSMRAKGLGVRFVRSVAE